MQRTGIAVAAFFMLAFCINSQSQVVLPDSTVALLKAAVEGFQNRYHSPSIVVAIVHDKKIIFSEARGYTDQENRIPASIDSRYPILSVTKMFTATMLMQLKQRNVVKLEDDVKKYVPEFSPVDSRRNSTGATLLQLATHTSGLPRNSQADINFSKQVDRWTLKGASYPSIELATTKEFLQSLAYVQKEYPDYQLLSCGDRHYSNLGYSLLGIALERAAKKSYGEYIVDNICKPLQMNGSGIGTETTGSNIIAKGYYYNDSTKEFIKTPIFKANSGLYAGGMYSTAKDLAAFISFQFDNSGEANDILSVENRAMMQSFRIGWKPSFPFVFHEGAMVGYRCEIAFNPELKIGWVILTNTTDFDFSRINEYFAKLLNPVFESKTNLGLEKFTGEYVLGGNLDRIKIDLKDGRLYSSYLQNELPENGLIAAGRNKFRGPGKGNYHISYDFVVDSNGNVKALNLGQLMWVKQ